MDHRRGLVLTGALLLLAGLAGLSRSLGLWGRATDPLLTEGLRTFAAGHTWFWPLITALTAAVALIGLRRLILLGDTGRLAALTLEPGGEDGSVTVAADAATAVLAAEIEALPGVRRARARLLGDPARPHLLISVDYADRADPAALRRHLGERALPRLRTALELDALPTVVKLDVTG